MVFLTVLTIIVGWLLGVWLPWQAILGFILVFVVMAYKGCYDGGLEKLPAVFATIILVWAMVIAGFITSDVTWAMIFGFTKTAFTGG